MKRTLRPCGLAYPGGTAAALSASGGVLGRGGGVFVPFFGVPAATIPMVSRIARMTGAKVVMAVTEMTEDGYVMHIEPPWSDFPGASIEEDTARMNRELERWVLKLPDQYLWTHKRFKTRPPGSPEIY